MIAAAAGWPAPARFLAAGAAWALALLWLLTTNAVEQAILAPLTRLQGSIALAYTGAPSIPIAVTLACSGADVLVLCLAVTLAYPTAWPRRLAGAIGGTILILSLNTARIAALAVVAGTRWFEPLHVAVLPAVLVVATLVWLALWMRWSDADAVHLTPSRIGRALAASTVAVVAYAAALPWLKTSAVLVEASRQAAAATADLLTRLGVPSRAADTMLSTPHGSFVVTPECLVTPLMAVYLACAVTLPARTRGRVLTLAALVPVFTGLVVVRLLTVGLPPLLGGRVLIATHAFHQVVLGLIAIVAVHAWRGGGLVSGSGPILGRAVAASGLVLLALGDVAPAAVLWLLHLGGSHPAIPATLLPPGDLQGAMFLLPSFVLALTTGLLIAAAPFDRRWQAPLVLGTAWAGVVGVVLAHGLLVWRTGLTPPVTVVRATAVALPLLALALFTIGSDDATLRVGGRRGGAADDRAGLPGR